MRIATTMLYAGGSRHEIGGVVYHFRPGSDPKRHIADVPDPDHAQRFLEIDGFEPADPAEVHAASEAPAADAFDVMTRGEMQDAYLAAFGKVPHHRLSDATMRERLRKGSED